MSYYSKQARPRINLDSQHLGLENRIDSVLAILYAG